LTERNRPHFAACVRGRNGLDQHELAGQGAMRSGCAMLSVSTLWLVCTINFLASGLMWAYVTRRYPELVAARYWSAGLLIAAAAPEVVLLHGVVASQAPLLIA